MTQIGPNNEDGNGNGDKNSGDGDTVCGDGAEMGTQLVGMGQGWKPTQWKQGGNWDRNNGDGWGWGPVLVPVQISKIGSR